MICAVSYYQTSESAQKSLERKIDKLNTLKQILYSSTFEPTDNCIRTEQ